MNLPEAMAMAREPMTDAEKEALLAASLAPKYRKVRRVSPAESPRSSRPRTRDLATT